MMHNRDGFMFDILVLTPFDSMVLTIYDITSSLVLQISHISVTKSKYQNEPTTTAPV